LLVSGQGHGTGRGDELPKLLVQIRGQGAEVRKEQPQAGWTRLVTVRGLGLAKAWHAAVFGAKTFQVEYYVRIVRCVLDRGLAELIQAFVQRSDRLRLVQRPGQ